MTFPVSIKGVVLRAGRVLLLRNDRDVWELPGGRPEVGETPEQCVVRETLLLLWISAVDAGVSGSPGVGTRPSVCAEGQ
jgi:hypothetical protein